jgi:hypothetical protein
VSSLLLHEGFSLVLKSDMLLGGDLKEAIYGALSKMSFFNTLLLWNAFSAMKSGTSLSTILHHLR